MTDLDILIHAPTEHSEIYNELVKDLGEAILYHTIGEMVSRDIDSYDECYYKSAADLINLFSGIIVQYIEESRVESYTNKVNHG